VDCFLFGGYSLHPASIEDNVFARQVRYFFGVQEQVAIFNSTDFSWVDWSVFSLVVDQPVDVEVLDGAHDYFDVLEANSVLSLAVPAD